MSGYAKLFSSILHSTIWLEENHVRLVWITMLAMANRRGIVEASVPGLAVAARVSLDECQEALAKFMGPDRHSRTRDHEGRRIAEVYGGWLLLNYEKHRAEQSADSKRENRNARQQRWRDGKRQDLSTDHTHVDAEVEEASISVDATGSASASGSSDPDPDRINATGSDRAGEQSLRDLAIGYPSDESPLVPCPCDLRLTEAQVQIAEMQGVSRPAIDAITARFISGYLSRPGERRSRERWLSGLSRAVHSDGKTETVRMSREAREAPRQLTGEDFE